MHLPPPLRIAIGFLTRLPIGSAGAAEPSFGRALAWFPWVGAGLGAWLYLARWAFGYLLAPPLAAALVVVAWVLATGGLHLDGLADVVDAYSGGRGDRERTLAIMRDSRIGAHGAAAVSLLLIAKVCAVAELIMLGRDDALLACPAVARLALVALILAFPYAREQGLGTIFRNHARTSDFVCGVPVVFGLAALSGWPAWIGLGFAGLASFLVARSALSRIGGLTGDVYGAAVEVAELTYLIAACAQHGDSARFGGV